MQQELCQPEQPGEYSKLEYMRTVPPSPFEGYQLAVFSLPLSVGRS